MLKRMSLMSLANLKSYRTKAIERAYPEESPRLASLQYLEHALSFFHERKSHRNIRPRKNMSMRNKNPFQDERKRFGASYKLSKKNGGRKSFPTQCIVSYDGYLFVERRQLTKRETVTAEIDERAGEAFKNGDRKLFVEIASSTRALYVRDNAVRLCAEMNWVDEARELLIKQTPNTYKYPVWSDALSVAFARLNNACDAKGGPASRHVLKTAVLSAVQNDREAIFNLLVPVVGIDFSGFYRRDIFDAVTMSNLSPSIQKKWVNLIIGCIDNKTSLSLLKDAIHCCAVFQLDEPLPRLLRILISKAKDPSRSLAMSFSHALSRKHHNVARCIIDELKKESIPIDMDFMHSAESAEDIEMIEYLCHNGCGPFPLAVCGEYFARDLRRLLSEESREDLYHLIVKH